MSTRPRDRERHGERGQVLPLFVIMLVVLLTALALVVNGGVLRRSNQELWNALDAGALAGAASLPDNPSQAAADAARFARINHPDLATGSIRVTYRCMIGDRNRDGQPDLADVPRVCNPGAGAQWTCANGKCSAVCVPSSTTTCNTVVVEGTIQTNYRFDRVTNVGGASTVSLSAACSGLCGDSPDVPLDIAFVIDRTTSMSAADLANVKNAALSTLLILDPSIQHVAVGVLGRSQNSAACGGTGNARGMASTSATSGTWVVVPYPTNQSLAADYLTGGALNNVSQTVRTISCFNHSSTGTNLGDPLQAVADVLISQGRASAAKGIVLMTDGAANQPNARSCRYANDRATAVKNRGIELYTIGFGVAGERCTDLDGTYANAPVTTLLANMATQPTVDNGCNDAENADGDRFFCEARSDSLVAVFRAAATALAQGGARLVSVPR